MVRIKLWNLYFHSIPTSLRAPQFFLNSGIDQAPNCLSAPAIIPLNFALFSKTIVFFWPPVAVAAAAAGATG